MVKRVPADIADIVYSGPVRGYAHKLWNLPEALQFRVHKIGAGDLARHSPAISRLNVTEAQKEWGRAVRMKTPRFIKVCWEHLHLGWEVDVERTINILMVSPTAQGVWHVLIISRQQSRFSVGEKSPLHS